MSHFKQFFTKGVTWLGVVANLLWGAGVLAGNLALLGELQLNQAGQFTASVTPAGDYAYVTTCSDNLKGGSLAVVDTRDATKLKIVSSLPTKQCIGNLKLSGTYAHAIGGTGDNNSELLVFNLAEPKKPTLLTSQRLHGAAKSLAVTRDRAYIIVAGSDGSCSLGANGQLVCARKKPIGDLRIFDLSTPSSPKLVGNWSSNEELRSVVALNNYAYSIATGYSGNGLHRTDGYYKNAGLRIVEVTDPQRPRLVSKLTAYGVFDDPVIVGNYVWILETEHRTRGYQRSFKLKTVNVANPKIPKIVGQLSAPACYFSLQTSQDRYAYLFYDDKNCSPNREDNNDNKMILIKVIDLADPTKPSVVSELKIPGLDSLDDYVNRVAVAGNYLYIAFGRIGLRVYQLPLLP